MGLGKLICANELDAAFAGTKYLELHTGDPGSDGQAANRVTGGGYAPVALLSSTYWSTASDAVPSVIENLVAISFGTASGTWSGGANITHASLWSHASTRTEAMYVGSFVFDVPQPVLIGNPVSIAIGGLLMSLGETD